MAPNAVNILVYLDVKNPCFMGFYDSNFAFECAHGLTCIFPSVYGHFQRFRGQNCLRRCMAPGALFDSPIRSCNNFSGLISGIRAVWIYLGGIERWRCMVRTRRALTLVG